MLEILEPLPQEPDPVFFCFTCGEQTNWKDGYFECLECSESFGYDEVYEYYQEKKYYGE